MVRHDEQQTTVDADALLFIEGGELQSGRLIAGGARKLRIVSDKGVERRLDRRKLVARVPADSISSVMDKASELADSLVMEQVWEVAAGEAQTISELAAKCMPQALAPARVVALVLANSRQRGFFRVQDDGWEPVPAKQYAAILASMATRHRQQELERAWELDLAGGVLPPELAQYLDAYVDGTPDPQDKRHRFLQRYGRRQGKGMADLAVTWGRISDLEKYHLRKLSLNTPPAIVDPGPVAVELGNLDVIGEEALAIDSKGTIEVDDAFGLGGRQGDTQTVYIHIAAPALGMSKAAREYAEQCMSTIYLPGQKHMMLPAATVSSYSLLAKTTKPCVSLELQWDAGKRKIVDCGFSLGKVNVACNLDIERFGQASLEHPDSSEDQANVLEVLSSVVDSMVAEAGFKTPEGHLVLLESGVPNVIKRSDFAAADKVVAALMVHYNKTAAAFLSSRRVPFLARRDGHVTVNGRGGQGQYGWFSSPLRRLADLVNQEQLLATLQGKKPPHSKSDLAAMARPFNQKYGWIQGMQSKMETYWSLLWLGKRMEEPQPGHTLAEAGKVRLANAPVTVQVSDCNLSPNTEVEVMLERMDGYKLQAWGKMP